ncbi:hypothetical protein [Paraliomyxa miuraensis]|uniref:hypothetical protein n=1 Tax=Paraliomyxa miuraensis TaxID=376150 RepID=UPI0022591823|nr:hypothetical protein [Paraliomyxa miuraensis]MCX4248077.1 hypothetical protein [Paraliomyxa miuraensis]
MTRLRAWARRSVALAASVALCGCAQVISRSTVEVVERSEASVLVLGGDGSEITGRGLEAEWTQDGDRLALRLAESRTCTAVRHLPVTRIERVDKRTARGAMWFEYGFGAAATAGGLVGLIRPEAYSQAQTVTPEGEVLEDKGSGYRIGGIFTAIGVVLLTAAVVDTVRTRDEVRYTDAYRRDDGGAAPCKEPRAPLRGRTVELLVGKWSTTEPTADDGAVRFLLPAVEDLPQEARDVIEATAAWDQAKADADAARVAAEEAAREAAEAAAAAAAAGKKGKKGKGAPPPEGVPPLSEVGTAKAGDELPPRPEPFVVKGVLRIDGTRAMAVSFMVPYGGEAAREHRGKVAIEPGPVGPAPGKARVTEADEGEGERDEGERERDEGGEGKPLSLEAEGAASAGGDRGGASGGKPLSLDAEGTTAASKRDEAGKAKAPSSAEK